MIVFLIVCCVVLFGLWVWGTAKEVAERAREDAVINAKLAEIFKRKNTE